MHNVEERTLAIFSRPAIVSGRDKIAESFSQPIVFLITFKSHYYSVVAEVSEDVSVSDVEVVSSVSSVSSTFRSSTPLFSVVFT